MRRLLTVGIVVAVAGIGAAAAVEALRGSSPGQGSSPGTASGATTSAETSPTAVTTTETASTVPTGTEPAAITGDVLTTIERGTDVLPRSAPAWKEEVSVCRTRTFEIVYDRDTPAILVRSGDQVLAWAVLSRREVSDVCKHVRNKAPASPSNEPTPQGIYESVRLRCAAPGRTQIDTHPIEKSGAVYGSLIYVTVAGTPEWLVSAGIVKDVEGRRVYVNYRYYERW